jgi:uncharacterized protein (DUF1778 family)
MSTREVTTMAKVVKKTLKTEVLHLRVTPDEKKAIEAAAAADHRTASGWIMNLIYAALDRLRGR